MMGARKLPAWMPNPDTIFEDLARLAAQTRRRGDPMPQWRLDAMARGRERAALERKRKGRERTEQRRRDRIAEERARVPVRFQFLLAMEPDAWYGWKELGRSIDQSKNNGNVVRWMLERDGWIEGTLNPEWKDGAGWPEPKWLYRITELGKRTREARTSRAEFKRR